MRASRFRVAAFVLLAACHDHSSTTSPSPVPVAAFTVGGAQQAGQATTFDATTSADPAAGGLAYSWIFGDGSRGGTVSVSHVYAQAGTYSVQLVVRDVAGVTSTASHAVTVAAGPAPTGTATVNGEVALPDGTPLAGATVSAVGTSASAQTAADGTVTLAGVPAGVPVVLRVAHAGHAESAVRLDPLAAGSSTGWFHAALAPLGASTQLASAQAGGTVTGPAGAQVVLPAGGLVHADGSVVSGAVDVSITPVDVTTGIDAFPGPFSGVQANGSVTPIASFGLMEVSLSQAGQAVQLAPGARASVDIPIFTGGAAAGQSIPVWSLDAAAGTWVQEGTGTVVASAGSPTGLVLRAQVSHLSWWNVDVPYAPSYANVLCLVQANPAPVPLATWCRVQARQEGVASPAISSVMMIPPNVRTTLPLFPSVSTRIYGVSYANPGSTGDVLVVNPASGASQNVDVVLSAPPPSGPQADVVAVGGNGGHTIISSTGSIWTPRASPFDDQYGYGYAHVVAWNGAQWVAGGRSLTGTGIAYSPDGIAWSAAPMGPGVHIVNGVAWNGVRWVAVGENTPNALFATSFDGVTWTNATSVPASAGIGQFVAWNGSYFLAGTSTGLLRSTDGLTWTAATAPFAPVMAGAWNGSRWVVVGGTTQVATSTDGSTWSAQTVSADPRAVAWNGTTWLIGGVNWSATSTNGTAWTTKSPLFTFVWGAAWMGTKWLAVGISMGAGTAITSPDGITWSGEPVPFTVQGRGVSARRPLYPPLP